MNNLGRTYFLNYGEISNKGTFAQSQMVQKYGAETYGISSQMKTDKGNGSANTNEPKTSGLIQCNVNYFMVIPGEGFKESSGRNSSFSLKEKIDELIEIATNDKKFNGKDGDLKNLKKAADNLGKNFRSGTKDSNNVKSWKSIKDILTSWKKGKLIDDEDWDEINNAYRDWELNKGVSSDDANKAQTSKDDYNPNYTYKIDIVTDFNDSWFQRKFKSGLLNKAIMAFKTQASKKSIDQEYHHEYKQDEMLPGDKRKLDSIQWKMTNKVAKDYVMYLLGWTRKKEVYPDNTGVEELKADAGFGKQMASKALDGRGIWGRLKQKIFSGGQNNNTISVVFQLADIYDGSWTIKEKKEKIDNSQEQPSDDGSKKEEVVKESVDKGDQNLVSQFQIQISESVMDKMMNEFIDEEYPTCESAIRELVAMRMNENGNDLN